MRPTAWITRFLHIPARAILPVYPARGLLLTLLLLPTPLTAATRTVTSLADAGSGSLRDAIAASDDSDTITFAVSGTILLTSGQLVVDRNLTILGPTTEKLAVSGNNAGRVFNILAGTVNIANLTIRDGRITGTPGESVWGGGIFNYGTLNMTNCTVCNNSAIGAESEDGPSGTGRGGGIGVLGGTLCLVNCTLAGNLAQGGNGGRNAWIDPDLGGRGGSGFGGGIAIADESAEGLIRPAYCTLINCTLSGNAAQGGHGGTNSELGIGGSGGNGWGGGIVYGSGGYNLFSAQNTIFAGNSTIAGAGGEGHISPGPNGVSGAPDISGAATSLGHNLVGKADESSGWIPSDLTGTALAPLEPLLGPLQDNGGPTPTMTLAPASPAVNAGDDAVVSSPPDLTTDQRGFSRWEGAHVDIGAFELPCAGASLVVLVAGSGHVTKNPLQACYGPGSLVGLWATPDPGWKFTGWSGNATSTNNPLILTLNRSQWITAQFEELPNLVTNGSFENTAGTFVPDNYGVMSLPVGSTAIPGWTVMGTEVIWGRNGNIFGITTPHGMSGVDLSGTYDSLPFGGVTQTLPTEPGKRYRFSLSVGSNADLPGANGRKEVRVTCDSASTNFAFQPKAKIGSEWRDFHFEFKAVSAATAITIQGVDAGGVYLGLDNVSVFEAPPVPPPTLLNARFGPDAFGFLLGGDPRHTFRIEHSEDLRAWHAIQEGVPGGSVVVDTDDTRRTAPASFYRAARGE